MASGPEHARVVTASHLAGYQGCLVVSSSQAAGERRFNGGKVLLARCPCVCVGVYRERRKPAVRTQEVSRYRNCLYARLCLVAAFGCRRRDGGCRAWACPGAVKGALSLSAHAAHFGARGPQRSACTRAVHQGVLKTKFATQVVTAPLATGGLAQPAGCSTLHHHIQTLATTSLETPKKLGRRDKQGTYHSLGVLQASPPTINSADGLPGQHKRSGAWGAHCL